MNRDDAIKKIKKCLALAASPNAHEASAAVRQAQKLMNQHGMNETDLSLSDVSEQKSAARHNVSVPWEVALSDLVASAFGCSRFCYKAPLLSRQLKCSSKLHYVFVGLGAAPELASYTYDVLARQCAKDRAAHIAKQPKACKPITKTARGDKFAYGWVCGVQALVDRFASSERNEALIEQYMAQKYTYVKTGNTKDRAKGRNVSHNDTMQGIKAGRNAKLDRGVGTGVQTQGLLT
jgi:hypothetical protein